MQKVNSENMNKYRNCLNESIPTGAKQYHVFINLNIFITKYPDSVKQIASVLNMVLKRI